MTKISVCIPVKNEDPELLIEVLHSITFGCPLDSLEIILYNDGSEHPNGTSLSLEEYNFPLRIKNYLKIINNKNQYGVGYAFDRCVEQAHGDILVLCGADIFPQKGWFYDVLHAVKDKEIGCCTSVGLQPSQYDINKPGMVSRYGARLMYTYTVDDLPKKSELREDPDFKDILEAKWAAKKSDEPYEIDCLLGAFYFVKKSFYQEIGGFDTIEGRRFHGHKYYGSLEPFLSLKARVYNGRSVVYPDIRVGHVFGRLEDDAIYSARAIREDCKQWNKLWIAHTMLDDNFRDEVINFPNHSLSFSQAQVWIKQHWDVIQEKRRYNKIHGKLISK